MQATFTEQIGHETYVYVRGQLVMKRWLTKGRKSLYPEGISATFHVAPGGVRWSNASTRAAAAAR